MPGMTSHPRQGGLGRGGLWRARSGIGSGSGKTMSAGTPASSGDRRSRGGATNWSRRDVLSLGAKGLALAGFGGSLGESPRRLSETRRLGLQAAATPSRQPRHLADLRRQRADQVWPGSGVGQADPADLQLGRVHQHHGVRELLQEVRLQLPDHDFQHHERGDREDADRRAQLRRLHGSDGRRARTARSRPSCSAPSTTPTSPTSSRHGRPTPTRSTTGTGVTPCRTRSTRPASPGERTSSTRTRTRWRIPGRCHGRRSTAAGSRYSTTTARGSASVS